MSICSAFLPSLLWKAFATFTSHTVFLLFFPGGDISLQQDVAAATRVPTWAFPSEVLDRRVVQWNLGLSGRIVPTSAPTLSWLSVGVAPAAKLTAAILRASRSDFAREPKTHFSVLCFIQEQWSHFAWLHFTHIHMSECWKTCKGNAFWFLFAFQSRWLVFVKFAKQKQHYCFILFFKIPFFFFFGDPSLCRGFEVMFRLWTPSPRGNHNKRRVHRFTSRGVNGCASHRVESFRVLR